MSLLTGLLLGGFLTSVVLWVLSGLFITVPIAVDVAVLGAAGSAVLLRDTGLVAFRVPQTNRQIARSVFDRGLKRGMLVFGVQLGMGVMTYISSGAPYILAMGVMLATLPLWGALIVGAGFGLGRFLAPATQSLDADRFPSWSDRWTRRSRWFLPLATVTQVIGWTAVIVG